MIDRGDATGVGSGTRRRNGHASGTVTRPEDLFAHCIDTRNECIVICNRRAQHRLSYC